MIASNNANNKQSELLGGPSPPLVMDPPKCSHVHAQVQPVGSWSQLRSGGSVVQQQQIMQNYLDPIKESNTTTFDLTTVLGNRKLLESTAGAKVGASISFMNKELYPKSSQAADKTLRVRRKAADVDRSILCEVQGCTKIYSSKSCMRTHVKLKHSGLPEKPRKKYTRRKSDVDLATFLKPDVPGAVARTSVTLDMNRLRPTLGLAILRNTSLGSEISEDTGAYEGDASANVGSEISENTGACQDAIVPLMRSQSVCVSDTSNLETHTTQELGLDTWSSAGIDNELGGKVHYSSSSSKRSAPTVNIDVGSMKRCRSLDETISQTRIPDNLLLSERSNSNSQSINNNFDSVSDIVDRLTLSGSMTPLIFPQHEETFCWDTIAPKSNSTNIPLITTTVIDDVRMPIGDFSYPMASSSSVATPSFLNASQIHGATGMIQRTQDIQHIQQQNQFHLLEQQEHLKRQHAQQHVQQQILLQAQEQSQQRVQVQRETRHLMNQQQVHHPFDQQQLQRNLEMGMTDTRPVPAEENEHGQGVEYSRQPYQIHIQSNPFSTTQSLYNTLSSPTCMPLSTPLYAAMPMTIHELTHPPASELTRTYLSVPNKMTTGFVQKPCELGHTMIGNKTDALGLPYPNNELKVAMMCHELDNIVSPHDEQSCQSSGQP
eukprot:CFRG1349T1